MKTKQHTSAQGWNPAIKLQNQVDFTGRKLFVGIDVHKERWQVAVYYDGLILSNCSIEGSSDALITHLRKRYGEASFNCVYECGPFGFTLCRGLWAAGMECIAVNPADIPGTDKERRSKTDQVDARKLAMHLAAGLLRGVYVPTEKLQKQRSLIRFRKKLWSDLIRAKNRLKSELKFHGIVIPKPFDNANWSHNFLLWVEQQAMKDEDLNATLLLMLEEVRTLRVLLLKTERKVRELMWSKDFKEKSELLRSIDGIGPLTSMLILTEVGEVRRFKNFDALNKFVGFCPDSHSSGESMRHMGLSLRRHNQLRSMLVEAAWQLVRRDPAMLDCYRTLLKRMKGQEAIIRIARKLLRRIRAVMFSGRMYARGIDGNITAGQVNAPALPQSKKKGRPKKETVTIR